jgi:hypothetical protein
MMGPTPSYRLKPVIGSGPVNPYRGCDALGGAPSAHSTHTNHHRPHFSGRRGRRQRSAGAPHDIAQAALLGICLEARVLGGIMGSYNGGCTPSLLLPAPADLISLPYSGRRIPLMGCPQLSSAKVRFESLSKCCFHTETNVVKRLDLAFDLLLYPRNGGQFSRRKKL